MKRKVAAALLALGLPGCVTTGGQAPEQVGFAKPVPATSLECDLLARFVLAQRGADDKEIAVSKRVSTLNLERLAGNDPRLAGLRNFVPEATAPGLLSCPKGSTGEFHLLFSDAEDFGGSDVRYSVSRAGIDPTGQRAVIWIDEIFAAGGGERRVDGPAFFVKEAGEWALVLRLTDQAPK